MFFEYYLHIPQCDNLFGKHDLKYLIVDPGQTSSEMSKDQVETIRSAMAGFQLPSSSIPPWASNLSDEEFQKMLQDKMSSRGGGSTRKKH